MWLLTVQCLTVIVLPLSATPEHSHWTPTRDEFICWKQPLQFKGTPAVIPTVRNFSPLPTMTPWQRGVIIVLAQSAAINQPVCCFGSRQQTRQTGFPLFHDTDGPKSVSSHHSQTHLSLADTKDKQCIMRGRHKAPLNISLLFSCCGEECHCFWPGVLIQNANSSFSHHGKVERGGHSIVFRWNYMSLSGPKRQRWPTIIFYSLKGL